MTVISLVQQDHDVSARRTYRGPSEAAEAGKVLAALIGSNGLTAYFQPIVSLSKRRVFGYEALCRTKGENPFGTIDTLFEQAQRHALTLDLDMLCRRNGIEGAAGCRIQQTGCPLFLNICPNSLQHPEYSTGATEQLAARTGLDKDMIVLEITERDAVSNYQLFQKVIRYYRKSGFRIAIDDFGAGYGGLKMLSILEPDFVKIDRHFFQKQEKSRVNYNLIDAIATACHRIGVDVIAEGIEDREDVRTCLSVGIDLLQGFYFARPAPTLVACDVAAVAGDLLSDRPATTVFSEVVCIGDIAVSVQPVLAEERALDALKRFTDHPDLLCLPVLENGRLTGLINRHRFMENHMVGRYGYGLNLNYYKKVADVMERELLQVPDYLSVEEVSRKVHERRIQTTYDDICVTRSGRYIGMVSVGEVLNAVTENSMNSARGANPLTGLPGNEAIQRQIVSLLSKSIHFDVSYIDIDSFKPFNDYHGFEKGDRVIKATAAIINECLAACETSEIGFAGHIGGDDFIVITRPKNSVLTCRMIIDRFEQLRATFHCPETCRLGYYLGEDRDGAKRKFGLLSLSIGIVSTEMYPMASFAEIASIAGDLKKLAKATSGSAVVRDRRIAT